MQTERRVPVPAEPRQAPLSPSGRAPRPGPGTRTGSGAARSRLGRLHPVPRSIPGRGGLGWAVLCAGRGWLRGRPHRPLPPPGPGRSPLPSLPAVAGPHPGRAVRLRRGTGPRDGGASERASPTSSLFSSLSPSSPPFLVGLSASPAAVGSAGLCCRSPGVAKHLLALQHVQFFFFSFPFSLLHLE